MRTTVSVDDRLLAAARRRARERGQTLGQVIEGALRRELAEQSQAQPVEVPVFRGGEGPLPGGCQFLAHSALSAAILI